MTKQEYYLLKGGEFLHTNHMKKDYKVRFKERKPDLDIYAIVINEQGHDEEHIYVHLDKVKRSS